MPGGFAVALQSCAGLKLHGALPELRRLQGVCLWGVLARLLIIGVKVIGTAMVWSFIIFRMTVQNGHRGLVGLAQSGGQIQIRFQPLVFGEQFLNLGL